jgi:hypothetical protein
LKVAGNESAIHDTSTLQSESHHIFRNPLEQQLPLRPPGDQAEPKVPMSGVYAKRHFILCATPLTVGADRHVLLTVKVTTASQHHIWKHANNQKICLEQLFCARPMAIRLENKFEADPEPGLGQLSCPSSYTLLKNPIDTPKSVDFNPQAPRKCKPSPNGQDTKPRLLPKTDTGKSSLATSKLGYTYAVGHQQSWVAEFLEQVRPVGLIV